MRTLRSSYNESSLNSATSRHMHKASCLNLVTPPGSKPNPSLEQILQTSSTVLQTACIIINTVQLSTWFFRNPSQRLEQTVVCLFPLRVLYLNLFSRQQGLLLVNQMGEVRVQEERERQGIGLCYSKLFSNKSKNTPTNPSLSPEAVLSDRFNRNPTKNNFPKQKWQLGLFLFRIVSTSLNPNSSQTLGFVWFPETRLASLVKPCGVNLTVPLYVMELCLCPTTPPNVRLLKA